MSTTSNQVENLKLSGASASKPPLGELPYRALIGAARVMACGARFYAEGNWIAQSAADAARAYDNALMRHRVLCTPLTGYATPETYAALDEKSDLPHIDHMIAGLLILRTLLIRDGYLPEDPGFGNSPANPPVPVDRSPPQSAAPDDKRS